MPKGKTPGFFAFFNLFIYSVEKCGRGTLEVLRGLGTQRICIYTHTERHTDTHVNI
jgi:hypothetical protein